MMVDVSKRKGLIAIPTIAIAGIGILGLDCNDSPPSRPEVLFAAATFINDASSEDPIHILQPEEGFDESNRLEPGGSRTTNVLIHREVEFRAGQNEVVFDVIVCIFNHLRTGTPGVVRWVEGSGRGLQCEGDMNPVPSATSPGAPE